MKQLFELSVLACFIIAALIPLFYAVNEVTAENTSFYSADSQ